MAGRAYVPDRGDVVWLEFDPQAGHEQAGHRPGRVAGNLGAALLLDQAHAAARAFHQPHERHAVLERVVLRVDPLLGHRRLRRAAADGVVIDVERHLAPADAAGADDGIRGPHAHQSALLVVLGFAGKERGLLITCYHSKYRRYCPTYCL